MIRWGSHFVLMISCSALSWSVAAQDQPAPKTNQSIDQAAGAFREGRLSEALGLMESLIKSAAPQELRLADQRLRE